MSRPYEYALALTSQFYFCGVPFRLDTSPDCAYGCSYCFRTLRGGNSSSAGAMASPSRLAKKLVRSGLAEARPVDVAEELLRQRVPVHFGGLSDPFCDSSTSVVSLQLLRTLGAAGHPVVLSTKNIPRLAEEDALEVLGEIPHLAIQCSLTTLDEKVSRLIEPGAPSPGARLAAARRLSALGHHMILRLQPAIPSLLDEMADSSISRLAAAGFRHVAVECLKIPVESGARRRVGAASSELRQAVERLEAGPRIRVGREWLMPTAERWRMLRPLISSIRKHGMTYGAADYGLYHLGDTANCCGVSALPGFGGWFRANITEAIRSVPEGPVGFDLLRESWTPGGRIVRLMNSRSRVDGATTVLDYLRLRWNRPGTTNAPDSYLGVSCTGKRDCQGDYVYFRHRLEDDPTSAAGGDRDDG